MAPCRAPWGIQSVGGLYFAHPNIRLCHETKQDGFASLADDGWLLDFSGLVVSCCSMRVDFQTPNVQAVMNMDVLKLGCGGIYTPRKFNLAKNKICTVVVHENKLFRIYQWPFEVPKSDSSSYRQ